MFLRINYTNVRWVPVTQNINCIVVIDLYGW